MTRFTWEMDGVTSRFAPHKPPMPVSTLSYRNDSTQAVMRTVTRNGRLVLNTKLIPCSSEAYKALSICRTRLSQPCARWYSGNVSLTRIHPTSVELKHLEAMRRKAAEKADSIAQSTTDTLNSKKEKQPETPDTTSVTKTPQRLSPAELRRQQQRQR